MGDFRRWPVWAGILGPAAVVAACSSGGGAPSTGTTSGSGAATGSSSAQTSGTGGAGGATTVSASTTGVGGTSTSGTGGAGGCAGCETLVSLPSGSMPYGIFVDAAHLYWTNFGTGEVMQANLDGTGQIVLATGEMAPISVQAQAGSVYWVSYAYDGFARKAPVGGGVIVDLAPAPGAREIFVGTDLLFWTGEPDDVQTAPLEGLPEGGAPLLLTNNNLPNGITADAASVYWTDRYDGAVKKADHMLGDVVTLGQGDIPWDIAVDVTSVYWTEEGSGAGMGKVMRASNADGSGATVIATEPIGTQGLAIDGSNVYWTNKKEGTIKFAPLAGGAVTVIASGQQEPVNVAVDGAYVYWSNSGGDTIVRAPKK